DSVKVVLLLFREEEKSEGLKVVKDFIVELEKWVSVITDGRSSGNRGSTPVVLEDELKEFIYVVPDEIPDGVQRIW
ncbi:hypothetical protein KI387_040840, partial [Taxus chinensis]